MKGVLDYLDTFSLKTGTIISLAQPSVTEFADGKKVINIPAYMLERLGEYDIEEALCM